LHASCAGDAWRHPVGILLLSAIFFFVPIFAAVSILHRISASVVLLCPRE
jgi:hypothetical protein